MSQSIALKATRTGLGILSKFSPKTSLKLAERLFSTPQTRPFTPQDLDTIAQGKTFTLKSGLVATSWGTGDKVLLVHGWQRHRASLASFIEPLLAKGKQVISFDAPAHGDSTGKRTNPIEYSNAILTLGQEIGPVEGVIAHSMGAGASVLALKEGFQANRIVLLASAANWAYHMNLFANTLGINGDAFIKQIEKRNGKTINDINAAEASKDLNQAALLFHDPKDARVPYKDSQSLANNWPGAELVTVENLGHGGVLHDPEIIRRAVDFIAK